MISKVGIKSRFCVHVVNLTNLFSLVINKIEFGKNWPWKNIQI